MKDLMKLKNATRLTVVLMALLAVSACDPGDKGYGWKTIKCYDSGKLVHQDSYNLCPRYAGDGYSELATGEIIKAQCRCSTGDS